MTKKIAEEKVCEGSKTSIFGFEMSVSDLFQIIHTFTCNNVQIMLVSSLAKCLESLALEGGKLRRQLRYVYSNVMISMANGSF